MLDTCKMSDETLAELLKGIISQRVISNDPQQGLQLTTDYFNFVYTHSSFGPKSFAMLQLLMKDLIELRMTKL